MVSAAPSISDRLFTAQKALLKLQLELQRMGRMDLARDVYWAIQILDSLEREVLAEKA